MRFMRFFQTAFLAAALLSAFSAEAELPTPQENVLKLEKPTIVYNAANSYELRLIDWDGQNDRLWMKDKKKLISFTWGVEWSPDGRRAAIVAFNRETGIYATYVLNLSTNRSENVTKRFDGNFSFSTPAWSRDSRTILLVGFPLALATGGFSDIYKLHLPSKRLTNLTNAPVSLNFTPSWSPVEDKIVFDSNPSGVERDIFMMNSDGGGLVRLTRPPHQRASNYAQHPSWSPDGKKIAFTAHIGTEFPDLNVFTMDADGSNIEQMTTSPNWDHAPRWSPDGRRLVYFSGEWVPGAVWNVFSVHVETKEVVQLTFDGGRDPRWVLAGKSRFLSVDPAGKKHGQWGEMKEAAAQDSCFHGNDAAAEAPPPQEDSPEEE